MKRIDLAEIKKLDIKTIKERVKKVSEEMMDLQMDRNMNKLTNLKVIKNKRQGLAQMLTIIRQKELLEKLSDEEGQSV